MGDIRVLKASDYMNDGIDAPDLAEKLVSQTLALVRTLDQACNIEEFQCCRGNLLRFYDVRKLLQVVIRDGNNTDVGVYGAEGSSFRIPPKVLNFSTSE